MDDQGQTEATPDADVGIMTDRVETLACQQCGCVVDVVGLDPFIKVECPDCSAINTVPARLGHFLLLELIGMGGMGGVYHAKDETLGRFVAIKVMLKSLGDDPQFIETFRREAQAVAKLNHPHIAQIYSFGQEKGQPYIVMELVSGERVDRMMESGEPLDQGLLMRIGLEIADGLRAADEAGIVHGDIKPENILLDDKGQAKLVDFGLASASRQASDGGIWGTPYYIAPEKVRRLAVDARADIYSLGATLYHALTGHPPFEGETPVEVVKARLERPPTPIKERRPDIDDDVARIVERMLEEDFGRRYPTYHSLISDLKRVVDKFGGGMPAGPRRAKTIRFARKRTSGMDMSAPALGAATPPYAGKGGRIVIRKGGSGNPRRVIMTPSGGLRAEATREITPEEQAALDMERRGRRHRTLAVLGTLLALGIATGLAFYVTMRRQQQSEARREWFAFAGLMRNATNAYTDIGVAIAQVGTLAAAGSDRIGKLQAHVLAVTGDALTIPELAPPEPPPAETAKTNTAPENATNAVPAAADQAVAETAPALAGDGAPASTPPEPEVDAPPAAPVDAPPIVAAALAAGRDIRMIGRKAQEAEALAEPALLEKDRARQCRASAELGPFVAELGTLLTRAQALLDETRILDKSARAGIQKVETLRAEFDRAEHQRIERERIEAENQRQTALDAERQRERQTLIDMELAEAAIMTNSIKIQLKQTAFAEAIKTIDEKIRTFKTAEGKAALQVLLDRYRMLEDLRLFLVRRMTEDPFSWEWIQSGSPRGISKADDKGIYVIGMAGPVPWVNVSPAQMIRIIDYYLAHAKTRASERGVQTMAASVYCFEHGGAGLALSKRYFDKALDLGFDNRAASRLLPFGW